MIGIKPFVNFFVNVFVQNGLIFPTLLHVNGLSWLLAKTRITLPKTLSGAYLFKVLIFKKILLQPVTEQTTVFIM